MKKSAKHTAQIMHETLPEASFEIRFWDDDRITFGEQAPQFVLWFKTKHALSRVMGDGFLGFGESYMDGSLEIEGDMQLLMRIGHEMDFGSHSLSLWEKLRFAFMFLAHQNTLTRSRKNISHHYDLRDDFYELFLDKSMAYTCAYYKTPEDTLEQAQWNKFEHICRKLDLHEGETLADLGCGWGGFLIHAATHHGVTGVGITLSKMQSDYANKRIQELGLQDRIQIQHKDYRELHGTFDKVASLGMLEHIGKAFIPTCVKQFHDLLKPKGIGLIHAIGNDTPFPDDPWTMKYMFPGSHIPALSYVIQTLAEQELTIMDVENIRMHYGRTIDHWAERYEQNIDKVIEMYGKVFARQWRLYWNVSSTAFKYGGNRLFHILFSKGLNNDYPLTRAHLYT